MSNFFRTPENEEELFDYASNCTHPNEVIIGMMMMQNYCLKLVNEQTTVNITNGNVKLEKYLKDNKNE